MSRSVAVPDDLYNIVAELAAKEHLSVEEFIAAALRNRIAGRAFLESRARLFHPEDFEKALAAIPDAEPSPDDTL